MADYPDDEDAAPAASNPNHVKALSDYTRLACVTCGVIFFLPYEFHACRKQDHKVFFCPSGHGIHFPAGGAVLASSLEEANRKNVQLLAENDQLRAENAELKKVK